MSNMQRKMGTFALTMTGIGSIIGSGWLFGAWKAAQIAGPAAIFSWVIGMVVILTIALSYAELGAMFPQAGGWLNILSIHTDHLLDFWLLGLTGFQSLQR